MLELYDEDELQYSVSEEHWDWELCETEFDDGVAKVAIPESEQKRRSFFDEGAGPPEVHEAELAWLDQVAMQAELEN